MNSNNQMIQKGKISSVEGKADRNGDKTTARVLPSTADSMVTRPLTWSSSWKPTSPACSSVTPT